MEKYNCPVCLKEIDMSSSSDWYYHMTMERDVERQVLVRKTWFICDGCSKKEGNNSEEFKCPPHGITETPYDPEEFRGVVMSSGSDN